MSRVGVSRFTDSIVKGAILVSFGVIVLLGSGPLLDAWLNYGILTGVFATVLLGVPLVGVGWMVYDAVFKENL